ncbi:MAG: hypothetical protein ABSA68_13370 [Xanthobacteraceae bacterium]|jgi:hypothetical protein
MAFRGCIPDFQIANPLYIGATVSFYTVTGDGLSTGELATLYSDPTSSTPAQNPQTLDSEGKFAAPVYIELPVIAQVEGPNVESHVTGVINARGTWRGSWVTDTNYFSSDFVQDPASGNVYAAALDYTSSSTLAADVAAGSLILVLSLSSIIGTIAVKQACLAATTANITLSGTQTVDGVALSVGERVLVKNQSTASQNGIYVVQSGAWTLATDFAQSNEVLSGCRVFVTTGTVNALSEWELTTPDPITVGTTSLTWSNNQTLVGTLTVSGTINVTGTFGSDGTAQTFPTSGSIAGTSDAQTLTNKTISGGTLSGTIAGTPTLSGANFVTLSNIANAAAYTLNGNPTSASANHADFTLGSLTAKSSPAGADVVLIADSAASGALKTTTVAEIVATGASAMVLLNTLTASNQATLTDITSLTSTYSRYEIVFENVVPATTEAILELQVYSGGAYKTTGYLGLIFGYADGTITTNTTTFIPLNYPTANNANAANSSPGYSGTISVITPSTAGIINWYGTMSWITLAGTAGVGVVSGFWNTSAVVTGFQVLFGSGNITSGVIKIYGIV